MPQNATHTVLHWIFEGTDRHFPVTTSRYTWPTVFNGSPTAQLKYVTAAPVLEKRKSPATVLSIPIHTVPETTPANTTFLLAINQEVSRIVDIFNYKLLNHFYSNIILLYIFIQLNQQTLEQLCVANVNRRLRIRLYRGHS